MKKASLVMLNHQRHYAPGSAERKGLEAALAQMQRELPFEVPCIVNGKAVRIATRRVVLATSLP